jgi:hypothetical protein
MDIKSYILAAIVGAIVVPLANVAYNTVFSGGSVPSLSSQYTTAAIVSGAIAGVFVVGALHLAAGKM